MKLFRLTAFALLLMTAHARAVPVMLRVVDVAGQPVGGVEVETIDYADVIDGKPTVPRTLKTAADGTLSLDLRGVQGKENYFVFQSRGQLALGNARVSDPKSGYGIMALIAGENTLDLQKTVRVTGVIQNATGAPAAGARVRLLGVENSKSDSTDRQARYGQAPIVATTGADGAWALAELPRGYARFAVSASGAAADEFALWLDDSQTVAPDIKLRAAGLVRGRILDAKGAPQSGVSVGLDDDYGDDVESDSEGRFLVAGAPVGENTLLFASDSALWLGVDDEVKATISAQGAIADVGDVRMSEGVLLSGTVIDDASQTPLAFAKLKIVGNEMVLQTDARGRFETRVKKPFWGFDLWKNYIQKSLVSSVPADATKFDLGTIKLERGVRLNLDLRDEAGNAVPQAMVRLQSTNIENVTQQRDSVYDGKSATVWPLPIAEYAVEGLGVWQVIEPKTISVTAPDAETVRTVTVRLRKLEPLRISGRVLDTLGNPIDEAEVQIGIVGDDYYNARSRKDGVWQLEVPVKSGPPMLGKVTAPSFQLVRGGELTRDGAPETNRWEAADIVMARTDVALAGRVIDERGAPVVGARVGWGDEAIIGPVKTDDNGNFTIEDLPAVPMNVVASDGPSYARITATPGVPVEIRLPLAAKLSDAELEKLLTPTNSAQLRSLGFYTDIIGEARVLEAIENFDAQGKPTSEALDYYLSMAAYRALTPDDFENVARLGVIALRKYRVAQLGGGGAASIALLAARSREADLRGWAEQWYEAQKSQLSLQNINEAARQNALRVATVGAALGRADANDALTIALFMGDRLPRADSLLLGGLLWNGEPQWFDEAIEDWAPDEQAMAIAGALTKIRDLESGRRLLERLQKLADAATPDEARNWMVNGNFEFVRAVAPFDANAAFEVLQKQGDARSTRAVFAVADAAWRSGQTPDALRVMRLESGNSEMRFARVCALALLAQAAGDGQLAQQFLESARQRIEANSAAPDSHDMAAYAFALHVFDAGAGRLLLEAQWARQNSEPLGDKSEAEGKNKRIAELQDLACAMAVYDVKRALQWLDSIPNQKTPLVGRAAWVRANIFAIAFATPQQQALALERWDSI